MAKKTTSKGFIKSTYNPVTRDFMATKEITLTTAQRIYAFDLLSMWKGNVATEAGPIMEGAKAIGITQEEQKEMNFRIEGTPPNVQRLWDAGKSPDKTIALNQETIDYLLTKMKERDDAKETGFLEINVVQELRDKLK